MTSQTNNLQPEFSLDYHAEITNQAASGALSNEQIAIVVAANMSQDIRQFESYVHFDNCNFAEGANHIRDEWNKINAENDRFSQEALIAFGRLLHTVQDFYAHSNWIELHLNQNPIPLWDFQIETLPAGIVSGTWAIGFPKKCPSNAPSHDELNKDNPNSKEGKKIVDSGLNQGKSYFQLAQDAAFRATRIQLARLLQNEFNLLPEIELNLKEDSYSREQSFREFFIESLLSKQEFETRGKLTMDVKRLFETVSNASEQPIEMMIADKLKTEGSNGEAPSDYGVSAQKLLVRGKGDLSKPSFSTVSVIQPTVILPETVIGSDDRIRVVDSETMPWRMICSLEIRGTIGGGIGTGWFAGPKTIITAGHCVFHPSLGGWAKEIKIAPGRYGSEFPFPRNPAQQPLVSRNFDSLKGWTESLNTDFDYAAIHLNDPVGNETGWFSMEVQDDEALKGLLVNVAGYPGDRDFGRYQYFASSKIDKVLPSRFFYEADTYGGQSGGPVWFQNDADQPIVIGVHSYGVGGSFTLNSATRINADVFQVLRTWIDADR